MTPLCEHDPVANFYRDEKGKHRCRACIREANKRQSIRKAQKRAQESRMAYEFTNTEHYLGA